MFSAKRNIWPFFPFVCNCFICRFLCVRVRERVRAYARVLWVSQLSEHTQSHTKSHSMLLLSKCLVDSFLFFRYTMKTTFFENFYRYHARLLTQENTGIVFFIPLLFLNLPSGSDYSKLHLILALAEYIIFVVLILHPDNASAGKYSHRPSVRQIFVLRKLKHF